MARCHDDFCKMEWQLGHWSGGRRNAGRVEVCSQGLSLSNLMKRAGRGGEFPASEGSKHLFLISLSIYDFLPLPPPASLGSVAAGKPM